MFNKVKCVFYECCQAPYLRTNFDLLERKMNNQLFGQPLVKKTLLSALKAHFELSDPRKALVLSFHGSTGVGIRIYKVKEILCLLLRIKI